MLISLTWLKKFLQDDPQPDRLAHGLTMSGLEVEKVEKIRVEGGSEDHVYEIGLTPNRSDAFSHFGVAREWAALTGGKALFPKGLKLEKGQCPVQVVIEDKDACPRYAGLVLENISVKDSPAWLKSDLKSIGIEPINNVVDVTNYVLHAIGQPLHAFDLRAFPQGKVLIGPSPAGTKFKTLDAVERTLNGQEIMIKNPEGPLCMGGIFGGSGSGVKNDTQAIFLESATFNPALIRRASKAHQLQTDASFRYERGTDPEINVRALETAALLLQELAGAQVKGGYVDEVPKPYVPNQIILSRSLLESISGMEWEPDEVERILSALGYTLKSGNGTWHVEVPGFRTGMEWPQDLVEELLRIRGLDAVPVPPKLEYRPIPLLGLDREDQTYRIKEYWANRGFQEIQGNSLVAREQTGGISLSNPLSRELKELRTSLVFSGVEAIHYNFNRGRGGFRFFEVGKSYKNRTDHKILEKEELGLWAAGTARPLHFSGPTPEHSLLHLKGAVQDFLKYLGLGGLVKEEVQTPDADQLQWTVKGQTLAQVKQIGASELPDDIGELSVYFAWLDMELLRHILEQSGNQKFQRPSRFPKVTRDLAFVISEDIPYVTIKELVLRAGAPLIRDVELFDEFKGKNLPQATRSLAIRMQFSDPSKTLTDQEINQPFQAIMQALEKEFRAVIRKG